MPGKWRCRTPTTRCTRPRSNARSTGWRCPVYHRGELVGSRRAFDERLTCFLLSERNRHALGQDHDARLTLRHLADEFEELVECVRKGIPLIADDDAEEYDEDDGEG